MKQNMQSFRYLAIFIATLWILHLTNFILGEWFYRFGLEPRLLRGLDGIIFSPWLHGSMAHLLSNTAGLLILGALLSLHGARTFLTVSVTVALLGGLATWIFARSGNHIGASGLIFGYFGYLVARGIVEKTPKGIVIALIVVIFYGGILWGVLPTQKGISWEAHLFGFLAGILAARWRVHHNATTKRQL